MAVSRCFRIHSSDNVATLLDDAEPGRIECIGQMTVDAKDAIRLGHKIALNDIREGEPIIKFGISIGTASREILAGQWVHLHNCRSNYDQRSGTLELESGSPTDTRYE